MLKIGLDLDDTINYWWSEYVKRFGSPKNDFEIIKNIQRKLKKDKEFWINLPLKHYPNFEAELFCTKRVIPKTWSREYLIKHNIKVKPIYQQWYQYGKKSTLIKGRIDVFIDDSISNFTELNLAGVPCLLMDSENNQHWGPIGRIYSLDYNEIEQAYVDFMEVFPNFKRFYDDFK